MYCYNSIKHTDPTKPTCEETEPMKVPVDFRDAVSITYSYSITFEVNLLKPMLASFFYVNLLMLII